MERTSRSYDKASEDSPATNFEDRISSPGALRSEFEPPEDMSTCNATGT